MTARKTKAAKPKVSPIEKAVVAGATKLSATIKEVLGQVFEATDIGSVVAEYDPGWTEAEVDDMTTAAGEYLLKQLAGALCYNALDPNKFAEATINNAFDQLRAAAETQEQFPSAASDTQVDNRMKWVVQQLIQKEFRSGLVNLVMAAHLDAVGEMWVPRKKSVASEERHTATQSAAAKLLAARK